MVHDLLRDRADLEARWNPSAYMQFARLRQRPVVELLDHIELCCPERIYDLGCGTGIATELLARRWPLAELHGVDSSVEMLEEAARLPIKASWERANLRHWCAERPASLLFAAAVLHFRRSRQAAATPAGATGSGRLPGGAHAELARCFLVSPDARCAGQCGPRRCIAGQPRVAL